jgi:hypothetical protein
MTKGTKVRLIDGNYSMRIEGGRIRNTGDIVTGCTYEVIETGLKLPTGYHGMSNRDHWNDTILKNIKTGELVFVEARFIRESPQPVPFMGAVKAYSEGKTIRCESECGVWRYKKETGTGHMWDIGKPDSVITSTEILEGRWYVEDNNG